MFPRMTHLCSAVLLCLGAAPLWARSGEGFVVRERPGLVFVKPQPWSKESEATMFEFQAFINRTAEGGSGAGYYEFRTRSTERRQVSTARIVKVVVYPDVEQFREIVEPKDRRVIVSTIEDLQGVSAQYPSSRNYLEPFIAKLAEEVARYDAGEVKSDGVWIPRGTYVKRLATKLASLLQADIARARPPSSLNLDDDPKFIGLKELAETNSDAKRLAAEVSTKLEVLVRAEKRTDLLAKLDRPGTSLTEARAIIEQLKTLQPGEDPKMAALLKAWDQGLAVLQTSSIEAEAISEQLERELASFTAPAGLPEISTQLRVLIATLNGKITRFLAGNPPRQLIGAIDKVTAVCRVDAGLAKLKMMLMEKQYIEVKDVLDDLAPWAVAIGPQTARVVAGLQRQAVEKIEQFTRLRAEGKLLVESGKKHEALDKFEAAFAVIPDPEIGEQISQLKQEVSAVSSKGQ